MDTFTTKEVKEITYKKIYHHKLNFLVDKIRKLIIHI